MSGACLRYWLKLARVEPGTTSLEPVKLRELKKRNRLLEPENGVLRLGGLALSPTPLGRVDG